jgi:hypothetical protein
MGEHLAALRLRGEAPRPLTVYELWIWLDTLMRFQGFDVPFTLEGSGLCMNAQLTRLPGGQRVVTLSGVQEGAA